MPADTPHPNGIGLNSANKFSTSSDMHVGDAHER